MEKNKFTSLPNITKPRYCVVGGGVLHARKASFKRHQAGLYNQVAPLPATAISSIIEKSVPTPEVVA